MGLGTKLRSMVSANFVVTNDEKEEEEFLEVKKPRVAATTNVMPTAAAAPEPDLAPIAVVSVAPVVSVVPVVSESTVPIVKSEDELTPEAVYRMLASLPDNLPMRVKRTAVRNAIQNQGKSAGVDLENILGEATWKKMQMAQRLQSVHQEHKQAMDIIEAEMQRLKSKQTEIQFEFATAQEQLQEQMGQMDRVIQFLGTDLAGGAPAPVFATGSGDELPPHLREETANRLLGIGAE
jgi:hypothetical protein